MYDHHAQFFTATILEWKKLLKPDKYKNIIVDSLKFLVKEERVKVYAFVIMPNHIHLIWKINETLKRERVQADFLKFTAQQIKFDLKANHPKVLEQFYVGAKDREYQIWERNPLSIDLYNEQILLKKLTYLHNNPVQESWKLSSVPESYPYSSAKFYNDGIDSFGFLSHYVGE
ncbi:MAG TPA: transposase [Cytophagales bacterium]|nr:transposase [Cytophagales bacterium]